MLFVIVIVMEALNAFIHEADHRVALSPLPGRAIAHQASLYADDLVVLVVPKHGDLSCLHQSIRFGYQH
jgi:hypothetical protein